MKTHELRQIIREEISKVLNETEILSEGFAANSKLADRITHVKKNAGNWPEPELKSAIEELNKAGVTSKDVFSFAALFPRDTFKVDDIRKGKLEAQIQRTYFSGSEKSSELSKAAALKKFILAFDDYYGEKNWYMNLSN